MLTETKNILKLSFSLEISENNWTNDRLPITNNGIEVLFRGFETMLPINMLDGLE